MGAPMAAAQRGASAPVWTFDQYDSCTEIVGRILMHAFKLIFPDGLTHTSACYYIFGWPTSTCDLCRERIESGRDFSTMSCCNLLVVLDYTYGGTR